MRLSAYRPVVTSTNGGDPTAQIAQAQGIVSVQADCSLSKALLLMRARAASADLSRAYVARGVLDGSIHWND